MERLDVTGLAVGLGISWAACMLFVGWGAMFGWGVEFVEVMSSVYIGFGPTFVGGIIGAAWGFVDGAIGGLLIAVVYNAVTRKKR